MEKSISELKMEFVSIMCGGEKKNNRFEIHFNILRYINLLFKKNFKFAELVTKIWRRKKTKDTSKVCAQK